MYIKASQLQHILGVIEILSLECGVSVSKKVKEEDEAWVEEAVFQSITDKGLGEVCKSLKIKEEIQQSEWWPDKPGYEEGEEAIEVVPKVSRSVRNSLAADDDSEGALRNFNFFTMSQPRKKASNYQISKEIPRFFFVKAIAHSLVYGKMSTLLLTHTVLAVNMIFPENKKK